MGIFTKSKTTVVDKSIVDISEIGKDSIKVGFAPGVEDLIINCLTDLYSDPPVAVVRELFSNATDADKSSEEIDIKITHSDEENCCDKELYDFIIIDYGCGMSIEQLRSNYIQYINSTKADNFEDIGVLGLGSKSPMAITPKYIVESCNGEETNIATIRRTVNGIYANIDSLTNVGVSYTKVTVVGIDLDKIKRMTDYVIQMLIPYSNRKINLKVLGINPIYDPIEEDHPILDKNIVEEYKNIKSIEFPCESSARISVYSQDLRESLADIFYKKDLEEYFDWIVRINNTVYRINEHSKESNNAIVIDIEPDFFAFAPSRETLPKGKELDFIIKTIKARTRFNSSDEYIKFIIENKIDSVEALYDYFWRKECFATIKNSSCFVGASKKQKELIDFCIRLKKDPSSFLESLGIKKEDFKIISFLSNQIERRGTPIDQDLDKFISHLFKIDVDKELKNCYENNIIHSNLIITGVEKNEKGELEIPSEYDTDSIYDEIEKRNSNFRDVNIYIDDTSIMHFFDLFVFSRGVIVPENLIKILSRENIEIVTDPSTNIKHFEIVPRTPIVVSYKTKVEDFPEKNSIINNRKLTLMEEGVCWEEDTNIVVNILTCKQIIRQYKDSPVFFYTNDNSVELVSEVSRLIMLIAVKYNLKPIEIKDGVNTFDNKVQEYFVDNDLNFLISTSNKSSSTLQFSGDMFENEKWIQDLLSAHRGCEVSAFIFDDNDKEFIEKLILMPFIKGEYIKYTRPSLFKGVNHRFYEGLYISSFEGFKEWSKIDDAEHRIIKNFDIEKYVKDYQDILVERLLISKVFIVKDEDLLKIAYGPFITPEIDLLWASFEMFIRDHLYYHDEDLFERIEEKVEEIAKKDLNYQKAISNSNKIENSSIAKYVKDTSFIDSLEVGFSGQNIVDIQIKKIIDDERKNLIDQLERF